MRDARQIFAVWSPSPATASTKLSETPNWDRSHEFTEQGFWIKLILLGVVDLQIEGLCPQACQGISRPCSNSFNNLGIVKKHLGSWWKASSLIPFHLLVACRLGLLLLSQVLSSFAVLCSAVREFGGVILLEIMISGTSSIFIPKHKWHRSEMINKS